MLLGPLDLPTSTGADGVGDALHRPQLQRTQVVVGLVDPHRQLDAVVEEHQVLEAVEVGLEVVLLDVADQPLAGGQLEVEAKRHAAGAVVVLDLEQDLAGGVNPGLHDLHVLVEHDLGEQPQVAGALHVQLGGDLAAELREGVRQLGAVGGQLLLQLHFREHALHLGHGLDGGVVLLGDAVGVQGDPLGVATAPGAAQRLEGRGGDDALAELQVELDLRTHLVGDLGGGLLHGASRRWAACAAG